MFKHLEDGGGLSILTNDQGEVLMICARCKRSWTGAFETFERRDAAFRSRVTGFRHAPVTDVEMFIETEYGQDVS